MNTPKTYLGDSVYACVDDQMAVVLTTENGLGPSNTIVLEPSVLANLLAWASSLSRAMEK